MVRYGELKELQQRINQGTDSNRGEGATQSEAQIDNEALDDGDRRTIGNQVDGRYTWTALETEICVVEISGPPTQKDHTHFVGDRNKIAKSLKKIMKAINKTTGTPISCFHLVGVQFYGKLYS